ncbi:MAG: Hsp33 family molecular chaperone HslO [Clostridia bacterium]|nr:Hsp33 family molecular chaperone HslO [Clostridia bacterium]
MQKDYLKKYYLCDNRVLLTVIKSTDIVNKAGKLHNLTPTTMAVLGRVLTMSAISSSKLKNEDSSVSAIVMGDGPVGRVVSVARYGALVKGYLDNPTVDLMPNSKNKLDVAGAVGKGKLRVIADYGFGNPYVGEVDLVSGEIAEDFTSYYATSLQQPCAIALGVLVGKNCKCESAGGLLIEVLPDALEDDIKILETKINDFADISKILKEMSIEEFVAQYFAELSPVEYETMEPKFKCDCSKSRMKKVLNNLGESEVDEILKEVGKLEICCDFCGAKREFQKSELKFKK